MAAALRFSISLALFLVSVQLLLLPDHVSSASADRVLFEEGYSVTTVIDGHKLGINPHSVLPVSGSSKLIVLDSVGSAFYSVPLPVSEDNAVKRLSGDGVAGYSDGELTSAQFNQPRSFTVDPKGNIYVADKRNHAIRKISSSGVKTIAGGFSQKTGRGDGPGRNASFSSASSYHSFPEVVRCWYQIMGINWFVRFSLRRRIVARVMVLHLVTLYAFNVAEPTLIDGCSFDLGSGAVPLWFPWLSCGNHNSSLHLSSYRNAPTASLSVGHGGTS